MDEIKKNIDVVIPCYNVEETIEDCVKVFAINLYQKMNITVIL